MIRFAALVAALAVPTLLHAHEAPAPSASTPKRVIIKTIKHMPDGSVVENTVENPDAVSALKCRDMDGVPVVDMNHKSDVTPDKDSKVIVHRTSKVMICASKTGNGGDPTEALKSARKIIEQAKDLSADDKRAALEAIDKAIAEQPSAK